jgi:hypothetical protein
MPLHLPDAELIDLFLTVLREQKVEGYRRVLEVTGVPRNTYYRMERGTAKRLNFETRGRMERYLMEVGALSADGDVIGVDVVEELIKALSHPAVRGFLGKLSANDRVNAALAYAAARNFSEQQKARIYRWAANEYELAVAENDEEQVPAASHSNSPT